LIDRLVRENIQCGLLSRNKPESRRGETLGGKDIFTSHARNITASGKQGGRRVRNGRTSKRDPCTRRRWYCREQCSETLGGNRRRGNKEGEVVGKKRLSLSRGGVGRCFVLGELGKVCQGGLDRVRKGEPNSAQS